MSVNSFWGSVLLIAGTAIGAGMLALPIATSLSGFIPSLFIFLFCWLVMLMAAFLFLEVNLSMKKGSHVISMASYTLGAWGKYVSWLAYLGLLYTLITAYISASAPILSMAFQEFFGRPLNITYALFILPLLFGSAIYFKAKGVDLINRLLMMGLALSFLLLIFFLPGHCTSKLLGRSAFCYSWISLPVVITSFGYHVIIPSLVTYMQRDRKRIRRALLVGSGIPLIIYILWQLLILGSIPFEGKVGLLGAWQKGESAIHPLLSLFPYRSIQLGGYGFSFFAIITSFIGVSLSLSDLLIDGLKIGRHRRGKLMAWMLTFCPPLIFLFLFPTKFVIALEYAGLFVSLFLIFLPAMMAWRLKDSPYSSRWGKGFLLIIILCAWTIILVDLSQRIPYVRSLCLKGENV